VPSFWRWAKGWKGGADVPALTAQMDVFPSLAQIAGAKVPDDLAAKLDGHDLTPLLKNPAAAWPERFLITHVGRWAHGEAGQSKYAHCSIRDARYSLVNDKELYDLQADPGQTHNVLEANAEEAGKLRTVYDKWWNEIQPDLVNENVVGPKVNPYKERYWKQFGGGPETK
jgi:arylsulfatase